MSKLPEIIEDVTACLDANRPVFVWGPAGIGKSEGVAQIAAARRKAQSESILSRLDAGERVTFGDIANRSPAMVDIRLSTFDPVDLRGLPAIVDGLTKWLRPAIWPIDNPYGLETVLFFDEMDRAAPAVANAALQIVLDRRIGEHMLPASVRIVAAGNGSHDARTTNKIGMAQANRFTHLYAEADADAAAAYWAQIALDPALCAFIRFRPNLIQTKQAEGEHAFASPRAIASCNEFMALPDMQRNRLVAGTCGKSWSAEFAAFVAMFRNLPSIESILRDPHGAPVSDRLDVNFAVSSALARKATPANFDAVYSYAKRMAIEFQIACMTEAVRRDKNLKATRAYVEFATLNHEV